MAQLEQISLRGGGYSSPPIFFFFKGTDTGLALIHLCKTIAWKLLAYISTYRGFRALLFVGFLVSGLWASTDVCALDALLWYGSLALINGVHTVRLCKKFMPPALSVELMELYQRVFKPLKVSQKHFRELTREAVIVEMSPGECYAVEEATPCDERLSILLRGRYERFIQFKLNACFRGARKNLLKEGATQLPLVLVSVTNKCSIMIF